jgi:uracil-DNA glycosylase family 4
MGPSRRSVPQAAATCQSLDALQQLVPTCEACPRLRSYCTDVARDKIKRFAEWTYHGRPVPGFGDPAARLLIVGLAPAAHGANRTGRLFTGDRSGDFLFAALHRAGLASQASSEKLSDGLMLKGVYVGITARCAPPANKPTAEELDNCLPFLRREIELLPNLRALLALGGIAHDAVLRILGPSEGSRRMAFSHGAVHALADGRHLVDSYHVSQQNTFTGRLTPAMFDAVIAKAMAL